MGLASFEILRQTALNIIVDNWLSKTESLAAYASIRDEASPSGIGSVHQDIDIVLQYCAIVGPCTQITVTTHGVHASKVGLTSSARIIICTST